MRDVDFLVEVDHPSDMKTVISKPPLKPLKERWRNQVFEIRTGRRAGWSLETCWTSGWRTPSLLLEDRVGLNREPCIRDLRPKDGVRFPSTRGLWCQIENIS